MITQAPRRELELNYSIEKIRDAIKQVCRLGGYNILEANDTLGIYRISIAKNLATGIMNITVSKIDDGKTKCIFEIFNTSGGSAQPATLSRLQDGYLENLSKYLDGSLVINDQTAPPKGCVVILPIIPIGLFIIYETIRHF
jgi:hypothetical protein